MADTAQFGLRDTKNPDDDRDLLANLNDAQTTAVMHENGPMLVVAGAGTGKTNVLTRRIAWLIETKRAKAEEILALTFTEKAAQEMQERTDILLPMGVTDTWIHTFHSFGRRMLEEEAILAGLPPDFTVMNESEQQVFLGDRLPTLTGLTVLRPLGNPFKFVGPIIKLISRAKDELISPKDYAAYAEKLAGDVVEGDENAASLQQELATIYAQYETWKDEAHAVDYGDLLAKLIQLAQENSALKQRLASRFKYVLVDEFQDTNVAQYELVKLLLGETRNLTVVGDDDQAIYKFRGAAVSNILGFLNDFPDATQVVLTDNYRSAQPILDAAYHMIQSNNPDRLEAKLSISKRLTAHVPGDEPVTFKHFATESDELSWITATVKELKANGTELHSIAVLARAHAQLDDAARVLTIAGIPVQTPNDRTFIHRGEIRGIVAFLKVVAHPTDSLSLLKLAMSPYYMANPEWLLHMNDAVRARNQSFHEVLKDEERPPWNVLPEEGREFMRRLRDDLARYRTQIASRTVWEIVYQFLHDRGALTTETPEDQVRVANLAVLFRAIKSYSQAGRDPHTLAFVGYLDQLIGTLESPANDVGPNESAVHLLTVHAAKGLEFDTVLVPSLIQGRFPGINRHDALELPDELVKERLPEGNEHLEEERRLFYVAMTRAKRKLYLSAAERYGGGRPRKLSGFVTEALPKAADQVIESFDDGNTQPLREFAPILANDRPLRYPESNGTITLSPAKLESYIKCPAEFYWRYVLNAPQVPTPVFTYGTAIHAGIEAFNRLRQQNEQNIDTLTAAAVDRFHAAWTEEGFVSVEQARQMLVQGEATLQQFIERNLAAQPPTLVEHWIHLTIDKTIAIRGRIDALWLDDEVEIRDYKTSAVDTEKKALEKAKENIPLRIYGYAIREETGRQPNRLVLDFVETNTLGILEPKDGLIDSVADVIRAAVEGIRAGKFDPTVGQHFCDVCGKI